MRFMPVANPLLSQSVAALRKPTQPTVHSGLEVNRIIPVVRRLFATSSLRWLHERTDPLAVWMRPLLERRPARLVTVALANKLARIAWAVMTTGELYRHGVPSVG
jgi:transposase